MTQVSFFSLERYGVKDYESFWEESAAGSEVTSEVEPEAPAAAAAAFVAVPLVGDAGNGGTFVWSTTWWFRQ